MLFSPLWYSVLRTLTTYCPQPLCSTSLTTHFTWVSPPCVYSGNSLKVIIGAVIGLIISFVFHLSGLTLCMMYCVLQTIVSSILSILGDCFRQESKSSPCYVVLAGSRYGGYCTFHLLSCPQFMYLKFF